MEEKSCGTVPYRKINDSIEFLLVKHNSEDYHYGFPKGHVEGNETELETAKRETLEETGFSCEIDASFRKEISYVLKSGIKKTVVFYLAKVTSKGDVPTTPHEIVSLHWNNFEKTLTLLTFEDQKNILKEAIEHIYL